jgi:MFS family permease
VIRASSAGEPDDARRGRPGWRAGGRRRTPKPQPGGDEPPTNAIPAAEHPRRPAPPRAPRDPYRDDYRRDDQYRDDRYHDDRYRDDGWRAGREPWRSVPPAYPPPHPRATYRPDGYPPEERPRAGYAGPDYPRDRPRTGHTRSESVAAEPLTRPGPPPPPPLPPTAAAAPTPPKKLTVTRVAAYRGKQISQQAVAAFRRAAHADGAHESGLTSLNYAVMINYASSATMAVGLANTLFFSAATAESRTKVVLYLLITVAPFALIAPVIGPMLDRVQRGRRIALAVSCVGQGLLSVVMALHYGDWLLYPAALGTMVLSKSFDVLKAAVAPRVLPSGITLAKSNARLAVFGLAAGAAFGALAAGGAKLFGSPGALWFTALLCIADAVLCLRIPAWVEVTEGEVPTTLSAIPRKGARRALGPRVVLGLWGNAGIRMLTGFLILFPAFVIKTMAEHSPFKQVLLLGLIGAAAGIGSFAGNAIGARLHFGKPDQLVIGCLAGALAGSVLAAFGGTVTMAAIATLIAAVVSGLAKISLDATIQNDLPEESRASAFGRSETILQLAWVLGGALGVLLPTTFWLGFTVVSVVMAAMLVQTILTARGKSLVPPMSAVWPPAFGRRRSGAGESEAFAGSDGEEPTRFATRSLPTERREPPYRPAPDHGDLPYGGR